VDDARPSPSKFTILAAACKPNRCRRFSEACGQDRGDGNFGNSLLWRAESTVIPRRSHTRGHKLEFDFDVCTVIGCTADFDFDFPLLAAMCTVVAIEIGLVWAPASNPFVTEPAWGGMAVINARKKAKASTCRQSLAKERARVYRII